LITGKLCSEIRDACIASNGIQCGILTLYSLDGREGIAINPNF
jgi:hypothetical protein